MALLAKIGDTLFQLELTEEGDLLVNGCRRQVDTCNSGGPGLYSLIVDGKSYEILVEKADDTYDILLNGKLYRVQLHHDMLPPRPQEGSPAQTSPEVPIKAPLCGLVVQIKAGVGQSVPAGGVVLLLESMKMKMELRSMIAGVVAEMRVGEGDIVKQQDILAIIRRTEETT